MAYKFPDGASFQFSTTFASAITIATFTNANPGVATSVGHGLADDDEVLFKGSWEDATDSVFRADQLSADTFSLQSLNTTDTTLFPAGGGASSTVQKITNWKTIPQVLTVATAGGDARRVTISPLARRTPINVPIGLNPVDITLTLGHDASNAIYQEMLGISRALLPVAFRQLLADGSVSYGYGNMVTATMPNLQSGRENQVQVAINLLGRDVAYGV